MGSRQVFVGSSTESVNLAHEVGSWLEDHDYRALVWDDSDLFMPGENAFLKLIEISKRVEAAIFIFSEDDRLWYRSDAMVQPRDNVLLEYGLFAGALGPKRAIICRSGRPKQATDLLGITLIDLDPRKKQGARVRLSTWARNLGRQSEDAIVTELSLQRDVLRGENEKLAERLRFEQQKARELSRLLAVNGVLDLSTFDWTSDGYWKLLFDYDYFWKAVEMLVDTFVDGDVWRAHLIRSGLTEIEERIAWNQISSSSTGVAKTLRFIRFYNKRVEYGRLLQEFDEALRAQMTHVARERAKAVISEG